MLGHIATALNKAMLRYAYVMLLVVINPKFKERVTKGYTIDQK